jgi:hypothetical protein
MFIWSYERMNQWLGNEAGHGTESVMVDRTSQVHSLVCNSNGSGLVVVDLVRFGQATKEVGMIGWSLDHPKAGVEPQLRPSEVLEKTPKRIVAGLNREVIWSRMTRKSLTASPVRVTFGAPIRSHCTKTHKPPCLATPPGISQSILSRHQKQLVE